VFSTVSDVKKGPNISIKIIDYRIQIIGIPSSHLEKRLMTDSIMLILIDTIPAVTNDTERCMRWDIGCEMKLKRTGK
jgi:hypothetical protein